MRRQLLSRAAARPTCRRNDKWSTRPTRTAVRVVHFSPLRSRTTVRGLLAPCPCVDKLRLSSSIRLVLPGVVVAVAVFFQMQPGAFAPNQLRGVAYQFADDIGTAHRRHGLWRKVCASKHSRENYNITVSKAGVPGTKQGLSMLTGRAHQGGLCPPRQHNGRI